MKHLKFDVFRMSAQSQYIKSSVNDQLLMTMTKPRMFMEKYESVVKFINMNRKTLLEYWEPIILSTHPSQSLFAVDSIHSNRSFRRNTHL